MVISAPVVALAVPSSIRPGDSSSRPNGLVYNVGKFIPPSGPREECFGRCRRDVTTCKKYAQATSTNQQMLRDWLNNCDGVHRKCRATCEPLKNNPQ